MTGEEARLKCGNWSQNSVVIFDDGPDGTSFIWGTYGTEKSPSLGRRWNRSNGVYELGFPHTGPNPSWIVIPDVLTRPSLVALLAHTAFMSAEDRDRWEPRIREALVEST